MPNPFFNMMNQQKQNNIFTAFQNFMQQNQGKNSHEILMQLIQQNGISQEQLNNMQSQAAPFMNMLECMKNKFGF